MTAPHVCILVQNLPLPGDRRVWLECCALRDAGYHVSAITPKGAGDPAYQLLEGVHLYKYDPPPPTRTVASFAYEFSYCLAQTARVLRRVWREQGAVDVLQACNPPDTFWMLAKGLRRRGTRFVYDQHDLNPELYRSRFAHPNPVLLRGLLGLERGSYHTADHVIATNESYRDVALERGELPGDRVTVVRTGPDSHRLVRGDADSALKRGRRYLAAYVGVMGPQDGVDIVLRAAHHIVHTRGRDDVGFAVLGRGDCYADLLELRSQLGLEDMIDMPGRVSDEVLLATLSSADVGLSPDPPNPLNDVSTMNKTMEYMALELPVLSFDLRESRVSADGAAHYVAGNSPADYGDALLDLLDDEERRATMGKAGRQRVENVLDWRHQREAYVAVYDRLTGRRGPTAPDRHVIAA